MNTFRIKIWLSIVPALLLIAGGGVLLERTFHVWSPSLGEAVTLLLVLTCVTLWVVGSAWIAKAISHRNPSKSYAALSSKITFAMLLSVAGALLLGFNTGFLPEEWRGFFFSWSMLIFLLGVLGFYRRRFLSGILFAAVGIFFLTARLSEMDPGNGVGRQFVSTWWPALVILFSLLMVGHVSGIFRPKRRTVAPPLSNDNCEGRINYRFIFSGIEQVILDPVFKGGMIDLIFGGMQLDLRHTSLPEGKTELRVKVRLGGLVILAPEDWVIEAHSDAILGGVNDSRPRPPLSDTTRKLIVQANCVLGGVEIK